MQSSAGSNYDIQIFSVFNLLPLLRTEWPYSVLCIFRQAQRRRYHGHLRDNVVTYTCNVIAYRNAVTLQVTDTIRNYGLNFNPAPHCVTVSCERYTMGFPVCYGSQNHHECKEGERSGRWWRVTLHVQTCSGRNRVIPLMRRPNIDSVTNMPVVLSRKQVYYVSWSRVPSTLTIRCYGTR
jgi:hypothetical protein